MSELILREDLDRVDLSDLDSGERIAPVTPGEVLRAEFLDPLGLTAMALAHDLNVPVNRITKIVRGERTITAQTAIALGARLGTSAEFWMNLQTAHDLEFERSRQMIAA